MQPNSKNEPQPLVISWTNPASPEATLIDASRIKQERELQIITQFTLPSLERKRSRQEDESPLEIPENAPKKHKSSPEHSCTACSRSFRRKIDLINHKRTHETAKHACTKCGHRFKSLGYFSKHECNACTECERSFTSKQLLATHRRLEHGAEYLECDFCGKCFSNRQGLVYHMRSHSRTVTPARFSCDICGKRFALKERLRLHMKHHEGAIECDQCGKPVKRVNLGHHMRHVHASGQIHACEQCGALFRSREGLRSHARTHERGFSCNECEKTFPTRYLLNEHAVLHRDPDSLTCTLCQKTFAQRYCLRTHMKTIHGDTPRAERLTCTICSYTTTVAENLRKHEKRHERKDANEKLTKDWLACAHCSMKLKNRIKLATHCWKKHNVVAEA